MVSILSLGISERQSHDMQFLHRQKPSGHIRVDAL